MKDRSYFLPKFAVVVQQNSAARHVGGVASQNRRMDRERDKNAYRLAPDGIIHKHLRVFKGFWSL